MSRKLKAAAYPATYLWTPSDIRPGERKTRPNRDLWDSRGIS